MVHPGRILAAAQAIVIGPILDGVGGQLIHLGRSLLQSKRYGARLVGRVGASADGAIVGGASALRDACDEFPLVLAAEMTLSRRGYAGFVAATHSVQDDVKGFRDGLQMGMDGGAGSL
jgi:hypothetical protein